MPTLAVQIRVRAGQREELRGRLRRLPQYITGTLPDRFGLGKLFKCWFAHFLLKKIHKAFLDKSAGGADELGDRWKPLSKSTIASRPTVSGEKKELGIQYLGRSGRGLLTAAQNRIWGGIFRSTFLRLAPVMGEAKAKAEAGRLAWAILKSRGAQTKEQVLGSRQVDILRRTGRLEESLRPGQVVWGMYFPPEEQILGFHHGYITMGTKVPYAPRVHKTRRLWPSIPRMRPWVTYAVREAVKKLVEGVGRIL